MADELRIETALDPTPITEGIQKASDAIAAGAAEITGSLERVGIASDTSIQAISGIGEAAAAEVSALSPTEAAFAAAGSSVKGLIEELTGLVEESAVVAPNLNETGQGAQSFAEGVQQAEIASTNAITSEVALGEALDRILAPLTATGALLEDVVVPAEKQLGLALDALLEPLIAVEDEFEALTPIEQTFSEALNKLFADVTKVNTVLRESTSAEAEFSAALDRALEPLLATRDAAGEAATKIAAIAPAADGLRTVASDLGAAAEEAGNLALSLAGLGGAGKALEAISEQAGVARGIFSQTADTADFLADGLSTVQGAATLLAPSIEKAVSEVEALELALKSTLTEAREAQVALSSFDFNTSSISEYTEAEERLSLAQDRVRQSAQALRTELASRAAVAASTESSEAELALTGQSTSSVAAVTETKDLEIANRELASSVSAVGTSVEATDEVVRKMSQEFASTSATIKPTQESINELRLSMQELNAISEQRQDYVEGIESLGPAARSSTTGIQSLKSVISDLLSEGLNAVRSSAASVVEAFRSIGTSAKDAGESFQKINQELPEEISLLNQVTEASKRLAAAKAELNQKTSQGGGVSLDENTTAQKQITAISNELASLQTNAEFGAAKAQQELARATVERTEAQKNANTSSGEMIGYLQAESEAEDNLARSESALANIKRTIADANAEQIGAQQAENAQATETAAANSVVTGTIVASGEAAQTTAGTIDALTGILSQTGEVTGNLAGALAFLTNEVAVANADTADFTQAVNVVNKAISGLNLKLQEEEGSLRLVTLATQKAAAATKELGNASDKAKADISGTQGVIANFTGRSIAAELGIGQLGYTLGILGRTLEPINRLFLALFPLVGVVLAVDIIDNLIEKFRKAEDEIRKTALAFVDFSTALQTSAESTELQNLKLEDQIRKLEGRPVTNRLKEALLETGIAAEGLTKKLSETIEKASELLEKADVSIIKAIYSGQHQTSGIFGFGDEIGEAKEQLNEYGLAVEKLRSAQLEFKQDGSELNKQAVANATAEVETNRQKNDAIINSLKERLAQERTEIVKSLEKGTPGAGKLPGVPGVSKERAESEASKEFTSEQLEIQQLVNAFKAYQSLKKETEASSSDKTDLARVEDVKDENTILVKQLDTIEKIASLRAKGSGVSETSAAKGAKESAELVAQQERDAEQKRDIAIEQGILARRNLYAKDTSFYAAEQDKLEIAHAQHDANMTAIDAREVAAQEKNSITEQDELVAANAAFTDVLKKKQEIFRKANEQGAAEAVKRSGPDELREIEVQIRAYENLASTRRISTQEEREQLLSSLDLLEEKKAVIENLIREQIESIQSEQATGQFGTPDTKEYETSVNKVNTLTELLRNTTRQWDAEIDRVNESYARIDNSTSAFFTKIKSETLSFRDTWQETWQSAFTTLTSGFANAISELAVHGKYFGQSMYEVGQKMLGDFINIFVQMAERQIAIHLAALLHIKLLDELYGKPAATPGVIPSTKDVPLFGKNPPTGVEVVTPEVTALNTNTEAVLANTQALTASKAGAELPPASAGLPQTQAGALPTAGGQQAATAAVTDQQIVTQQQTTNAQLQALYQQDNASYQTAEAQKSVTSTSTSAKEVAATSSAQAEKTAVTTTGETTRSAVETSSTATTTGSEVAKVSAHAASETAKTTATITGETTRTAIESASVTTSTAKEAIKVSSHTASEAAKTASTITGETTRTAVQTSSAAASTAKEGVKVVAHSTSETAKTTATITGEAARTAIQTTATTASVAKESITVAAHTTAETAKTASTTAGEATRTAVEQRSLLSKIGHYLLSLVFHTSTEAKKTATVVASQAAQTAAVTAGQVKETTSVVVAQAAQTAAVAAAQAGQTAAVATAAAAKTAIGVAANVTLAESDIGLAAAIVFLEAIEEIPFPANIAAAPALAAVTYAEGLPYVVAAAAATGGLIEGEGTGTSDSILMRLSHGEYVIQAESVNKPGMLPLLHAINTGLIGADSFSTAGTQAAKSSAEKSTYASSGDNRSGHRSDSPLEVQAQTASLRSILQQPKGAAKDGGLVKSLISPGMKDGGLVRSDLPGAKDGGLIGSSGAYVDNVLIPTAFKVNLQSLVNPDVREDTTEGRISASAANEKAGAVTASASSVAATAANLTSAKGGKPQDNDAIPESIVAHAERNVRNIGNTLNIQTAHTARGIQTSLQEGLFNPTLTNVTGVTPASTKLSSTILSSANALKSEAFTNVHSPTTTNVQPNIHFHNDVQALDGEGVGQILTRNHKHVSKIVENSIRRGIINPVDLLKKL